MMGKRIEIAILLLGIVLAGCAPSQPKTAYVDLGPPGELKVSVFYDVNGNGVRDSGEPGVSDAVGIKLSDTCPAADQSGVIRGQTDANGTTVFRDLIPGMYCVTYLGSKKTGSQTSQQTPVDSKDQTNASFALQEK
jgi:hypothetical protein